MNSDSHLSGRGARKGRSKVYYKTIMCRYHMSNCCSRGDGCQFAHSPEDLRVAPDLTRTKMCAEIIRNGRCEVPNCRFAHSRSQLRFVRMSDLAGDDGNVPQLEHPPDMRHWDQPPAVNVPHSRVPPQSGTEVHQMVSMHGWRPPETSRVPCKEVSVVGSGHDVFWKQPSGGRRSSQEENTDVQGGFLPVQSSRHLSADPFMASNSGQCAALLPSGSCRSTPAPFQGKTEDARGEGRLIGNPLAEVARGPGPQSSYLQPPAAPGFTAGEIPLAGFGSPLIPALDHVSGDKKLRVQEEPKLAAMQERQHVHACAQAPRGLGSASCQDYDACEGSFQNIFGLRFSV
mmetsp:Transcript_17267/g.25897  ORF Transcript_17267/g.25897 Transcript_17267/m.25897 type:complete len:344 (+) Transcript_17267:81-1112(+)